jgi:tetraacyldisaccharide 4'-kinase
VSDEDPSSGRVRDVALTAVRALSSILYATATRIHRAIGRRMRIGRAQPTCAVLSVGGLTLGGAGKTPVAAAFARALAARGRGVVLASRGYGGRASGPVTVVSDGTHVYASTVAAGDESLVLAAHAPGVPVLVGRDRRVVGHAAVSMFGAEVLVLDDGFQHHRLARDLDVVCVDGFSGFGNGRVVPWGTLREPIGALRDADWLCVVDGDDKATCAARIRDFASEGGKVVHVHRRPREIVSIDRLRREPARNLAGQRVGLLAGIARPDSLRRTLEELGAEVIAEKVLPDHHVYRAVDLVDLDSTVPLWITTEKDALKILPEWLGPNRLLVLSIDLEFEDEEETIAAVESALFPATAASIR